MTVSVTRSSGRYVKLVNETINFPLINSFSSSNNSVSIGAGAVSHYLYGARVSGNRAVNKNVFNNFVAHHLVKVNRMEAVINPYIATSDGRRSGSGTPLGGN